MILLTLHLVGEILPPCDIWTSHGDDGHEEFHHLGSHEVYYEISLLTFRRSVRSSKQAALCMPFAWLTLPLEDVNNKFLRNVVYFYSTIRSHILEDMPWLRYFELAVSFSDKRVVIYKYNHHRSSLGKSITQSIRCRERNEERIARKAATISPVTVWMSTEWEQPKDKVSWHL
jgi:hypothetical protein